jgi:two-component system sensor histidine kinase/response regulator
MSENEGKRTILIVDDSPENIDILSASLADEYDLRIATSGESALEIAESAPLPDLILLDIIMPEMDGYEVCRQLKARERTRDIPVIFVTVRGEEDDERKGFDLGGADYIRKPVRPAIVAARVRAHLLFHQQKRELSEAYEQLKALEQLRDDLIHMVVHDMRSPLAAISGGLDLMIDNATGNTAETYIKSLLATTSVSAKQLTSLVNSILDIGRLEAGKMPLTRSTQNLKDVANAALAAMQPLATHAEVTIQLCLEDVVADVDPEVIRRVIENLLGNAIKFTPGGRTVEVSVSARQTGACVEVSDQGPGIAPEARDLIFDKFAQAASRTKNQKYSTGLGLTFCKLAVEAHGGSIDVESEMGKGSRFCFVLPTQVPAH